MTYQEAYSEWVANIRPDVVAQYGADDGPALSESWNDYTDSLAKDGEMTATEYHHCPAEDDEMPDDQGAFLLGAMGVVFSAAKQSGRPDDVAQWAPGSSHYLVTIARGTKSFQTWYSMGSAHTNPPELSDVMASLLMDTSDTDSPFEEWADGLGYDTDSRKAEAIYRACLVIGAHLSAMFTTQELEDLREVFADY